MHTKYPCPFCGSTDLHLVDQQTKNLHIQANYILCRTCHACGPICRTKEDALHAYGLRCIPQSLIYQAIDQIISSIDADMDGADHEQIARMVNDASDAIKSRWMAIKARALN